jgi:hypothetical protein
MAEGVRVHDDDYSGEDSRLDVKMEKGARGYFWKA